MREVHPLHSGRRRLFHYALCNGQQKFALLRIHCLDWAPHCERPTVPTVEVVQKDPYQLEPKDLVNPPRSFFEILRRIGPGMILASSIVGSGELIATTVLGAQVGYA